eukprot:snap_masked-scaffold_7-processed-gene-13.37-mRNA-1 protein AED:1.00 eAED:1.00 QI:0/-1/0/0/-1/1/1/0/734
MKSLFLFVGLLLFKTTNLKKISRDEIQNLRKLGDAAIYNDALDELGKDSYEKEYVSRKELLRDHLVATGKTDIGTSIIHAYLGFTSPGLDKILDRILSEIPAEQDPDFDIVKLVRLMYFTDKYDNLILPVLQDIPFWLTPKEKLRVYWSENHIIMWTSSSYLIRSKFGKKILTPDEPDLEERILSYLKLKIRVGFYEFFSHTYWKYTFSGLLNLYDFALDPNIIDLSFQALNILLADIVKYTNNKGFSFVSSGRDHPKNFLIDYGTYINSRKQMYELVTGNNYILSENRTTKISFALCFLLTSSFLPYKPMQVYSAAVNEVRKLGHEYHLLSELHNDIGLVNKVDKTIFQFSYGGYGHPGVLQQTFELVSTMDLWEHKFFAPYKSGQQFPFASAEFFARILSSLSKGSIVHIPEFTVWKKGGVILSSMKKYYPGHKGYQQFPWMATVGDLAVFTLAVDPDSFAYDLSSVDNYNMNSHLPSVKQIENVIFIDYHRNKDLRFLGINNFDVFLSFEKSFFDHSLEMGLWTFGDRSGNFIAVYQNCPHRKTYKNDHRLNKTSSLKICEKNEQLFFVAVGTKEIFRTFHHFVEKVLASKISIVHDRCTKVKATILGKIFIERNCSQFGNFTRFLFGMVPLAIFAIFILKHSLIQVTFFLSDVLIFVGTKMYLLKETLWSGIHPEAKILITRFRASSTFSRISRRDSQEKLLETEETEIEPTLIDPSLSCSVVLGKSSQE